MVESRFHACWAPTELSAYIEAMPTHGLFPERTVLVPHARIAEELRRQLASRGSPCLVGTHFLTPSVLAEVILRKAGVDVLVGEEALREHRIAQLVEDGLDPPGFGRALLQETVGWPAAFASTIGDLERAGLRPDDLPLDEASVRGTKAVWEVTDTAAGASWTQARAVLESAVRLEQSPGLLDHAASFLAIVMMDTPASVARLLRAISGVEVVLLAARPLRPHALDRLTRLFGSQAHEAVLRSPPMARDDTDLGVAAAHLFHSEQNTELADRPRAGAHPDGTLMLLEYDGARAEIDAAVDWVVRQILAGTALDRIAVLVPAADPWCSLVASALRGLDWGDADAPITIAGGASLANSSTGARVSTVLNALEQHLAADALVDVLACVRVDHELGPRPSRSRVFDLVHSLGTRGGSGAHPEGSLEWRTKIAEAEVRLSTPVELDAFVDQQEHVERRRVRLLDTLHAVRPALLALCDIAEALTGSASLALLRPLFVGFVRDHLAQPTRPATIHALLDERLDVLANDSTCGRARGRAALGVLRRVLSDIRTPPSVANGAAIYLGTVESAAGSSFDAVRIIGLSEGSIPPTLRGDPVLSDDVRMCVGPLASQGPERAVAPLHDLDLVVRGVGRQLSLSAPRLALDRTVREPSSLFLEVGAALGRLDGSGRVPSLAALRRSEIRPALDELEQLRLDNPQRASDWQDRLAAGRWEVPERWRAPAALDLVALTTVSRDGWQPTDGVLPSYERLTLAGLDATRPTSTWRLSTLLSCPHRFLYEHVLDWYEPASAPPGHELDASSFGALVHAVVEHFLRRHGAAFARRDESLTFWQARARDIASAQQDELLVTRGFDSRAASDALRRRLLLHVERLLEQSWVGDARRFVETEWAFGVDTPVRLPLEGGDLYVRGRVDLVEAQESETFVGDIKTGRCHPRRGDDFDPTHRIDLQLGVYAHVVQQFAAALEVPQRVGAGFRHSDDRKGSERSFRGDDGDALRTATLDWLETARGLLASRSFPRTPDDADCRFCSFRPVCSDADRHRSKQLLQGSDEPALVRFRTLKETT